jgi:hypothetical protein
MKSLFAALLAVSLFGCATSRKETAATPAAPAAAPHAALNTAPTRATNNTIITKEISLFDGKSLEGWQVTGFGGHGEVQVDNGLLKIGMGAELSGVHWTNGGLPNVNYEIALDVMKTDGGDFFCGLTFPVKDSFCSLILGGWGGGVVGLSSLDGMDASENDTSKNMYFEKNRWFHVRVRVLEKQIQTWIDEQKVIDVDTTDRKVGLRAGSIEMSAPLGLATYQTDAAYRNIVLRPVKR